MSALGWMFLTMGQHARIRDRVKAHYVVTAAGELVKTACGRADKHGWFGTPGRWRFDVHPDDRCHWCAVVVLGGKR